MAPQLPSERREANMDVILLGLPSATKAEPQQKPTPTHHRGERRNPPQLTGLVCAVQSAQRARGGMIGHDMTELSEHFRNGFNPKCGLSLWGTYLPCRGYVYFGGGAGGGGTGTRAAVRKGSHQVGARCPQKNEFDCTVGAQQEPLESCPSRGGRMLRAQAASI